MVEDKTAAQSEGLDYIHKLIGMRFRGDDVARDIKEKYGFDGDLVRFYAEIEGAGIHKWSHYFPIYERYFAQFRGRPVRMLEIGVDKGGSLMLWRRYFGEAARIFGIDINPSCAQFDGQAAQVRIGSQNDPAFLHAVVEEMGGVDLVLDDGSHVMGHSRNALRVLFPLLSEGGVYMIEDLHTAYWPRYRGGVAAEGNFFNDVREFIDEMHRPYNDAIAEVPEVSGMLSGIHVHDSIVVLDKNRTWPPVHSRVG